MRCHAVFIDTVAIQRYVFSSNKLKENLGASYLVEDIFEEILKKSLNELGLNESILTAWMENTNNILIKNGSNFEVGFIGGGNALLFFKDLNIAHNFIKDWTARLLIETPGLQIAIALSNFDINNYSDSMNKISSELKKNKNIYHCQTIIPRHGMTAECTHSGFSMETYNETEQAYVSSVVNAKILAAKDTEKKLNKDFGDLLSDEYCFTDQLDKLGQKKHEDSHIAVVHIDGNNMADRFREIKTLPSARELSKSVKKATIFAVRGMIEATIKEQKTLLNFLDIETFNIQDKKQILPFRPIIIGGDDIAFVSEGRLGIWLAEKFLQSFAKEQVSDNKPLSACAGIAITKTKYPFYRGYTLAEELCRNAKNKRKEADSPGSWLDFHISFGGISGSLNHIRNSQYKAEQGSLLMRPYSLDETKNRISLETIKTKARELGKIPNNKLKDMRNIMTLGEPQRKIFVNELSARGYSLPKFDGKDYHASLFENAQTPYFDMIELMEFHHEIKEV